MDAGRLGASDFVSHVTSSLHAPGAVGAPRSRAASAAGMLTVQQGRVVAGVLGGGLNTKVV